MGSLVILAAVILTTTMSERAGLMTIYARRRRGEAIQALGIILEVVRKMPGILGMTAALLTVYLLCLVPLAAAGTWYFLAFLSSYDLNYLFQARPPAFWWGLAAVGTLLVAALALGLFLYIRLILALPALLFQGKSPLAALLEGVRVARGSGLVMTRLLLIWIVITTGVGLLLDGAMNLLGILAGEMAPGGVTTMATLLGTLAAMELLVIAALSFLVLSADAILVVHCYRELRGDSTVTAPALQPRLPAGERTRLARWVLGAAVVAFALFSITTSAALMERAGLRDDVIITAHRGASAVAPENTLSAIEKAIELGADYAEIDVQEIADGTVVVFHDSDLVRVAGLDRKIWTVTSEELQGLDAGGWFSPEFAGEPVPTLQEAIETARGRIGLNIELKVHGHEKRLVESVVETVEAAGFEEDCIITSLKREAIMKVRELNPRLEIGYILYQKAGNVSRLGVEHLMFSTRLATDAAIVAAQGQGKQVHVWTVNDRKQMSGLLDRGVNGILTDYPDRLKEVLAERRELTDLERVILYAHHKRSLLGSGSLGRRLGDWW
jgi:glycerophosphoryl diester phosphodiesterase